MKYCESKINRVFIIRLENNDKLPDVIEQFCNTNKIIRGICLFVGGINNAGKIVVGPRNGDKIPVDPMIHIITGVHESLGVGTIFPDEQGNPVLHMHASLGRKGKSRTGCIRTGVSIWKIGEIILFELTGTTASRVKDKETGFEFLEP